MARILTYTGLCAFALLAGCGKPESKTVILEQEGVAKTTDVTKLADGTADYKIIGDMDIPAEAKALHAESRKLGQAQQYDAAIAKLNEAIVLAPEWPYPRYDLAFTYLLKQQTAEALKHYRTVDQLVPEGFMTTKTAIWTLEREQKGLFPQGLYLGYVMLEWQSEAERREGVALLIENVPNFSPGWKAAADLIPDPEKRILALEQGLSAGPDAETYGVLMINKALALQQLGRATEGKKILTELASSPDSTLATRGIAQQTLKQF